MKGGVGGILDWSCFDEVCDGALGTFCFCGFFDGFRICSRKVGEDAVEGGFVLGRYFWDSPPPFEFVQVFDVVCDGEGRARLDCVAPMGGDGGDGGEVWAGFPDWMPAFVVCLAVAFCDHGWDGVDGERCSLLGRPEEEVGHHGVCLGSWFWHFQGAVDGHRVDNSGFWTPWFACGPHDSFHVILEGRWIPVSFGGDACDEGHLIAGHCGCVVCVCESCDLVGFSDADDEVCVGFVGKVGDVVCDGFLIEAVEDSPACTRCPGWVDAVVEGAGLWTSQRFGGQGLDAEEAVVFPPVGEDGGGAADAAWAGGAEFVGEFFCDDHGLDHLGAAACGREWFLQRWVAALGEECAEAAAHCRRGGERARAG